jgi:ATP/maltotriose-dependent transcriptional regulator MalT
VRVLVVQYAHALYYGPAPVPEATRRCAELLAEMPGAPTFEAGLATMLAGLRAMEGRFDEARALYADSVAVYQEFGLRFRRAVRSIVGARIESLAGDLAAAEHELRTGYSMLEEMGERGARSTLAGCLADVLSTRGDDVEAARFADITRETAAEADVMPQVLWRRAMARTAVRSGDVPSAEALAQDAVALASKTDALDLRAGTLLVLGEVLQDAGKGDDASASTEEARALYELKGNRAALRAFWPTHESVS